MIELILAISAAVIISAGCSLFEAVLYSVPMRRIEANVHEGKRAWKIFKEMRENVEKPIAAILSLNTIANTAGAAVAGAAAASVFGHRWLGYFSAAFTLAILIFSEIMPKTIGVVYGKGLVSVVAYPMRWLVAIMTPAIWLSGLITRMIARRKIQEAVTGDELRIMAKLSLRTGGIKPYQERAIERILTLQAKTVEDVMTPRTVIFSLHQELTLREAKQAAKEWEHSRFPIYDKNQEDVVGIGFTKELFISIASGKEDLRLKEIMHPVHFVVETARLSDVLMEFLEKRQHLFVVLDEYGGLAGLVSLEDVLEEILGREIIDESDRVEDKQEFARKRWHRLLDRGR